MNNFDFPGELQIGPITLSDLASDNHSIRAIFAFAKTINNSDIQKDLYSCLRLACDALCMMCDDLNINPDVLDYWDGKSQMIVTPFDPTT